MKLAYWMYAGPAHIGTLRVACSFKNVHAIMHAPLGDDYFNVMRSMLERERDFTPVTASIVDRHVLARGSQEKVAQNITRKDKEERPDLVILTPTCTSSILQEDLQNFVNRAATECDGDVLLADVNHYRVSELQAADRTLEQVVRFYIEKAKKAQQLQINQTQGPALKTERPTANIIGILTLGFHNLHDARELKRLLYDLGIGVNLVIPEGSVVTNLQNLPKAWFNIVPYREVGLQAALYLEKECNMPFIATTPMGIVDTATFVRQIQSTVQSVIESESKVIPSARLEDKDKDKNKEENSISNVFDVHLGCKQEGKMLNRERIESYIDSQTRFLSQAAWFSRSIDCQNLTGKKAVVFGDATHAASITRILAREMGIRVSCAGTYCKHDADWFREQVQGFCDSVLISEDHTEVSAAITRIEPSAIFGTQMERHIGKRLGIPCGVISAPVHIQNFTLGYRPFLGYEGTNQIADLVYNSFTLGMEDHLLEIFGGHDTKEVIPSQATLSAVSQVPGSPELVWEADGLAELNKIPGFVRGKVKRNTENYAASNNISKITVSVMFAAKEAVGA